MNHSPGISIDAMSTQEMAPDLRRKVDATRAARLAREAEAKSEVKSQVLLLLFFRQRTRVLMLGIFQTGTTDLVVDATKPKWADKPPSR